MSGSQFKALACAITILIFLMLWMVLPPVGWAILALVALSFGVCWVAEQAIKVWRR